jgi:cytochrome d ubiquinol oxidase subunit I
VTGVSAYHLFKRTADWEFFRKSLRIGVFTTLPALVLTVVWGGIQFGVAKDANPMKIAVFGRDDAEIARLQAEQVARYGPGDYVPPAGWVQTAGTLMMTMFAFMMVLAILNVVPASIGPVVRRGRIWHLLLMITIPMPFVAMIAGWIFREMGRQPWVVNGLLKTSDAVSGVSAGAMRASLITFTTLFGVLILVNYAVLARHARRGPDAVALGRPADTAPEPVPVATF